MKPDGLALGKNAFEHPSFVDMVGEGGLGVGELGLKVVECGWRGNRLREDVWVKVGLTGERR